MDPCLKAILLAVRILGIQSEQELRQSKELFHEVCVALSVMKVTDKYVQDVCMLLHLN